MPKLKIPRAWTREEKDAADQALYKSGHGSIAEVDANGNIVGPYLSGPQAQQILKRRKRKPKAAVTGGG